MNTSLKSDTAVTAVSNPKYILQSVLTALSHGKISEAVDQFDDDFTFNDQALGLEFTDKGRLSEFFQKSRELFPDTVVEVISTFESRRSRHCGMEAYRDTDGVLLDTTSGANFVAGCIDRRD